MKITNDIRDVCNMSESDIMRLTGKSALRTTAGTLEDAKDFYGNTVTSICDETKNAPLTLAGVASINLPLTVAQTQFDIQQVNQYICTRKYMDAKMKKVNDFATAIAPLSVTDKIAKYGYTSDQLIKLIGMNFD